MTARRHMHVHVHVNPHDDDQSHVSEHPYEGTAFCPRYHLAVELIGRRWTGAILRALLSGATRFSDIAELVPGLSDRLLSERLKELEVEGIVIRTVIPETPVRIEYHLTTKGDALQSVVEAVSAWAETWVSPPAPPEVDAPRADAAVSGAVTNSDGSD